MTARLPADPFGRLPADPLEAHSRQPQGRIFLTDDPMSKEERAAEEQRKRVQAWHRKKGEQDRARRLAATLHAMRP